MPISLINTALTAIFPSGGASAARAAAPCAVPFLLQALRADRPATAVRQHDVMLVRFDRCPLKLAISALTVPGRDPQAGSICLEQQDHRGPDYRNPGLAAVTSTLSESIAASDSVGDPRFPILAPAVLPDYLRVEMLTVGAGSTRRSREMVEALNRLKRRSLLITAVATIRGLDRDVRLCQAGFLEKLVLAPTARRAGGGARIIFLRLAQEKASWKPVFNAIRKASSATDSNGRITYLN